MIDPPPPTPHTHTPNTQKKLVTLPIDYIYVSYFFGSQKYIIHYVINYICLCSQPGFCCTIHLGSNETFLIRSQNTYSFRTCCASSTLLVSWTLKWEHELIQKRSWKKLAKNPNSGRQVTRFSLMELVLRSGKNSIHYLLPKSHNIFLHFTPW